MFDSDVVTDENLEYRMSVYEVILESKDNIHSSFLSRSFDVVMIMSFIWRQYENSEDADEHDEYGEWCE